MDYNKINFIKSKEFVINNLKSKKFYPVYFFLGEEVYLKEELISIIKNIVLKNEIDFSFNLNCFYSSDDKINKIIETANTFPVFSEKRLIIVYEAEKIFKTKKEESENNKLDKEERKIINNYLSNPSLYSIVIFNISDNNLPNWVKFDEKNCNVIIFYKLDTDQLKNWVKEKVNSKYKKNISDDAISVIIENCDNSLLEIEKELEKIDLYTEGKKEITIKDVLDIIIDSKSYQIFDLTDALINKDFVKSIEIFRRLKNSFRSKKKEEILKLFFGVNNFFHNVWEIKNYENLNFAQNEIMKILEIKNSYRYKKLREVKDIISNEKFLKIFKILQNYDKKFKSESEKDEELFEELIYKICHIVLLITLVSPIKFLFF